MRRGVAGLGLLVLAMSCDGQSPATRQQNLPIGQGHSRHGNGNGYGHSDHGNGNGYGHDGHEDDSGDDDDSTPPPPCEDVLLENNDANDNPRDWAWQQCPDAHVLAGVRYGSMGAHGADFVDAVAPVCVPESDPFAAPVYVPNSEMEFGGEITVLCPSGQVATGLAYSELNGLAPNPDQLDAVTVICGAGAVVANADLGAISVALACRGPAVGLAYKDKPNPNSDFAESVTPLCACDDCN